MLKDNLSSILILVILTVMSAYFSATETAFSSLNRTKLKTLAEKGNKRAEMTNKLADNYDRLLSTILIGNNIVNIAAASIATVMFVKAYGDVGATLSTVFTTVIILIFGEITPKSVSKDCPEKFAMFSAPLIKFFIYLLLPLNFIFSLWKKLISKIFKLETDTKMSHDELLMLVDEVQQDGSVDEDEGELLKNAIEFNDIEAEDILTHRVDLEAVSIDSTKEEIAKVFAETKFSRILVYEEDIDHIVGVIHLKDFYTESGITKEPIKSIITPAIFVMKNEKVSDILRELQKEKSHIAVVVDEYGGTYGIVTMEDIIEELVGEIWDEHDEVDVMIKKTGPDTYEADGYMEMNDFCDYFDIKIETESVSLGGWTMEQFGQIPEEGESFDYENINIKVLKLENHRVALLQITVSEKKQDDKEKEKD